MDGKAYSWIQEKPVKTVLSLLGICSDGGHHMYHGLSYSVKKSYHEGVTFSVAMTEGGIVFLHSRISRCIIRKKQEEQQWV